MADDATPLISKARILALCGAKSNSEVTKLQLENLGITDENYEIFYLNGWIEEPEGDPELEGLVHGPFYSWVGTDLSLKDPQVVTAVKYVMDTIDLYGPFDGVYGFSQGALIASLVAGISGDDILMSEIQSASAPSIKGRSSTFRSSTTRSRNTMRRTRQTTRHKTRTAKSGTRASMFGRSRATRGSMFGLFGQGLEPTQEKAQPRFKFGIFACSACHSYLSGSSITSRGGQMEDDLIPVKSIHIVGIEDPIKTESEGVASMFANPTVLYHPGGHSISRDIKSHVEIIDSVGEFVRRQGEPVEVPYSTNFVEMSEVSSIAVQPTVQIGMVQLKDHLLPGGSKHKATILECLGAQDENKPFLNHARDTDGANATTYGELKEFIEGGNGDLRRLGVQFGDVVAYGAPPVSCFFCYSFSFSCINLLTGFMNIFPWLHL